MKTTTHKSALKKAIRFAAIGTTLYTLFVPMLQVTFYDKITWLNFCEHPWINNAWFLFFNSVLLLSWAAFALGIIRDGEHFPPINKWVRYALLVLAIVIILLIPSYYWRMYWHSYTDLYVVYVALICVLNCVYPILLWYLYARTSSANTPISSNDIPIQSNAETASSVNQSVLSNATPSRSLRWSRCVCWIIFSFILALMLDYVAILADYAKGVLHNELYHIETARQMWYWTNHKCYLLRYMIPLAFSLCLFLQPIINRRSDDK